MFMPRQKYRDEVQVNNCNSNPNFKLDDIEISRLFDALDLANSPTREVNSMAARGSQVFPPHFCRKENLNVVFPKPEWRDNHSKSDQHGFHEKGTNITGNSNNILSPGLSSKLFSPQTNVVSTIKDATVNNNHKRHVNQSYDRLPNILHPCCSTRFVDDHGDTIMQDGTNAFLPSTNHSFSQENLKESSLISMIKNVFFPFSKRIDPLSTSKIFSGEKCYQRNGDQETKPFQSYRTQRNIKPVNIPRDVSHEISLSKNYTQCVSPDFSSFQYNDSSGKSPYFSTQINENCLKQSADSSFSKPSHLNATAFYNSFHNGSSSLSLLPKDGSTLSTYPKHSFEPFTIEVAPPSRLASAAADANLLIRVILNIFLVAGLLIGLFSAYASVMTDIQNRVTVENNNFLEKIMACRKKYRENNCSVLPRLPIMEEPCIELEKCMSQDPALHSKVSHLSAKLLGEIINTFVEQLHWRTITILMVLFIVIFVGSNWALALGGGVKRRNCSISPSRQSAQFFAPPFCHNSCSSHKHSN